MHSQYNQQSCLPPPSAYQPMRMDLSRSAGHHGNSYAFQGAYAAPSTYGNQVMSGDLMGPEVWEAAQMARAEAMLVSHLTGLKASRSKRADCDRSTCSCGKMIEWSGLNGQSVVADLCRREIPVCIVPTPPCTGHCACCRRCHDSSCVNHIFGSSAIS